jgi:DNA mismatch repair protein MutS
MKSRKNINLITALNIFAALLLFTKVSAAGSSLSSSIADNYLRAFSSEKIVDAPDFKGKGKNDDFDIKQMRPPKLGPNSMRSIIFNTILTKSAQMDALQQHMQFVLNQYAWNDLKLFFGSTSAPQYHLLGRINRSVTVIGEAILAALLVTPTSNITELKDRQTVVKSFVKDINNVKRIRTALAEYKDAENSILSFYSSTDPLYTKEYRNYMEDYYYAKNNDSSNKSASWLEFKKRFFRDFWGITWNFTYPYFFRAILDPILSGSFGKHYSKGDPSPRKLLWTSATPIYGGVYKWNFAKKSNGPDFFNTGQGKYVFFVECILPEIIWLNSAYKGVANYIEYSHTLRNLAMRMSDIQLFVKTAEKLSNYIASSPELEEVYGSRLIEIRKLLTRANDGSEVGNLVKYLLELPYKSWSYFFNNAGKLLASHTLFVEHKDEFADAMYELGQLDAYTSIAVLVDESQKYDKDHAFTFVTFLDRKNRSKPYIKLTEMWNPFIDAKVAVGNDIEMGDSVRNITLTGPNAGGKSTFLTGVTNSLLLCQSFGIAPAKEAIITPFDKINTYIDITDDIAAGNSLFMAEVKRAQAHIKIIKSLKQNEFAFTIFDEPFSGTNPTEGAAAEYSILEALASYTNSLTIVATHYPIVMLLEDMAPDKGFANYKVFISEENHLLHYSYKVVPGKSTQAIAIRILEEEGFDTALLTRAKDIIKNPQKYKAHF